MCRDKRLATKFSVGGISPQIFCLCPHTQTVQILNADQIPVCVPGVTLLQNFSLMKYDVTSCSPMLNTCNSVAERQPCISATHISVENPNDCSIFFQMVIAWFSVSRSVEAVHFVKPNPTAPENNSKHRRVTTHPHS